MLLALLRGTGMASWKPKASELAINVQFTTVCKSSTDAMCRILGLLLSSRRQAVYRYSQLLIVDFSVFKQKDAQSSRCSMLILVITKTWTEQLDLQALVSGDVARRHLLYKEQGSSCFARV